jgi:aryl-alcohol dehydrogenase-like predicted oxidoreductase
MSQMHYRHLGRTGLKVSRIALGTTETSPRSGRDLRSDNL